MLWLLGLIILGMLSSCKTKYIPVETVIRDSVEINDTVRIINTQFVDRFVKDTSWMQIHTADSVELAKMGVSLAGVKSALVIEKNTVKQLREKLSENNDTSNVRVVYVDRVKKVDVPYPVPAQITKWQRGLMNFGYIGLGIVLLLIVTVIIKVGKWLRARSTA
jgi:hypothetical protein